MKVLPGFVAASIFVLSTALKQQSLEQDTLDQAVQTSSGFNAAAPPVIFRGPQSAVFLEASSSNLAAREAKVEALAKKEQAALLSQQQAMEAMAQQQKLVVGENAALQAQMKKVEAKEQKMEEIMTQQSQALKEAKASRNHAEALLQQQSGALLKAKAAASSMALASSASLASTSLASSAYNFLASTSENVIILGSSTAQLALRLSQQVIRDQLIGGALYVVVMCIIAYIYGVKFTYEYPKLEQEPVVTRANFSFGLLDGMKCSSSAATYPIVRDARIPCFSCCALPVRWADTASSMKINYLHFWAAVIFVSLCEALAGVTYYITGFVFIIMAVILRQRIRRLYGMPYATCGSCTQDLCVWSFCAPCATMQEAMEVEYIEPPAKPWQQSMSAAVKSITSLGADTTPLKTQVRSAKEVC
eukprot:CAMPEP_0197655754 /NCGR_PEP_ID=MMETSP1338-20131121/39647_1 /TAXON_ID=43686 ORGANISM="Pelagodinium beii, Strain RCC1491" /NCGR_SAMPLE_ID=MMETSP1338 /ASSEMBLY_ACC=CAM_ASM_000754 /LENGTH=417 /DNA_ID=CAMNT_0043231467 /DNA_START=60 /DNA_END=1313 /DNA_ORIENTATION=-